MAPNAWTWLRRAALFSLAAHLVAGLAMAGILRHGLDTNPDLESRLRFLADRTTLWIAAWATWNIAALSIVAFYAAFAAAHRAGGNVPRFPLKLAILLGANGMLMDLSAEAIEMGVLPDIARQALTEGSGGPEATRLLFLTLHRTAVLLTGYAANGLYTLAALLLVISAWKVYPAWVRIAGLGVGVFGFALSAAALADSVPGMVWSNAGLVPCILLWQIGVAIIAWKRTRATSHEPRATVRSPSPP